MSTRGNDDPLMVIVSSTGYSTDSFEHDEEQIIMDSKKPKTPRKNMTRKAAAQENSSTSAEGVSFVFQKHHSKIDWRILNTIDVDRIIRDVGMYDHATPWCDAHWDSKTKRSSSTNPLSL